MVEKSTILLMVTALKLVNSYDQKTCDVKYSGEKQIVYDISCQESNVSNICCFLTSSDKPEKFFWGDCNERNNYLLIDIVAKSVADGCSVRLCSKVNQKGKKRNKSTSKYLHHFNMHFHILESVEFSIYAYQNDNGTQEHIFTSQPFHIYSRHCKMKHQMGDRFERATNITIVGNPSQTFKNVPFEVTCRKKCQITNCLYYSWNYKDFACNTFNSDENVIGFCPLIGWISLHYEDSEDDEACTTQITFDDQCLAHNFSIKASGESHQNITDFSQCSKKCSHNCSYFAWNPLLSDCTTFSNDSVLEFCSTTTTEDSLVIGCNKEILLNAAGLNILYASVSMAMVAIIIWIIYKIYQRSTSASHDIIQMRSNNSVKRQRSILEMKSLTRVRLEDFAAMHMANLIPKKEEFDYLATIHVRHHILQFSTEVAALYPDRNRYKNVVPYDYNRVKLIQRMHDSDYINASWIRGHREIAAQGPLPNTVEHFLQMVVEQKVEAIVMLTSTTEQKRDGNLSLRCITVKVHRGWLDPFRNHCT